MSNRHGSREERAKWEHSIVREVIHDHLGILFSGVARRAVLRYQDIPVLIQPEVEEELQRELRRPNWTLRPDFLLNTIRMISKHSKLKLAICGDSVWRVKQTPQVNIAREDIVRNLRS